jgi:ABC-type transport system substrate-binding protein
MRRIVWRFLAAISLLVAATGAATAETRPHYGGTLRVMLQSAPESLNLPASLANTGKTTPPDYWDSARVLSLIGDTLVTLDAEDRPQPALAVAWQSDASGRHWQFTARRGVKFHDGSAAGPAAIAQILSALHKDWIVRASADSVSIDLDSATPMPSLLAELALPRNLLLKRNLNPKDNQVPIGTGAFLVADWQPGKRLRLAASEESWAGRPFVNAVEIEFGHSLRDQATALELNQTHIIEAAPDAGSNSLHRGPLSSSPSSSSSSSLPVELLALVFPANSRAQDPRLREALALAIDRKPIQSVLLKGAGEPAGSILPNWMTGYSAVFPAEANAQRARALLAGSRPPTLNLSYDPRDQQAQLIAERIALNAREIGMTVQVSLSAEEDIRLLRVALPSADPATSLAEAARQLGLAPAALPTLGNSVEDLYQSERSLLDGHAVIPLFHLPVASAVSAQVRGWALDRLGAWGEGGSSIGGAWLTNFSSAGQPPLDSYRPQPEAGSR